MTGVMVVRVTPARCVKIVRSLAFRGMTNVLLRPRFPLPVRALLTVIAMFAEAVAGGVALLLPDGAGQTVAVHLCSSLAALALAIALVRGVDRRPVAALGMGRAAWPYCLIAIAVTAACTILGTTLTAALGLATSVSSPHTPGLAVVVTMLTQAVLLQAFPEELLFRGYLVQSALGRLSLRGVVALSVLVFSAPHLLSSSGATTLTQRVLFLLLPLGFALIATAVRLRSGSVWPAVAVHGTFHLSWFVSGHWFTPRTDVYGVYLAVAGGVFLLAGLAAAWWAVRPGAQVEAFPADTTVRGRPA